VGAVTRETADGKRETKLSFAHSQKGFHWLGLLYRLPFTVCRS